MSTWEVKIKCLESGQRRKYGDSYYHYVVMLRMKQATKNDEEKLVNWCSFKKNILFCTKRIGSFDFEINAAITDINDLNSFLSELRKEFGGFINNYELIINSKLLKLNYVPFS